MLRTEVLSCFQSRTREKQKKEICIKLHMKTSPWGYIRLNSTKCAVCNEMNENALKQLRDRCLPGPRDPLNCSSRQNRLQELQGASSPRDQ
jgi:hypothetical protein